MAVLASMTDPEYVPDPAAEAGGGLATSSEGVVQLQRSDFIAVVDAAVDRAMGVRALEPGRAGRFGRGGGGGGGDGISCRTWGLFVTGPYA